MGKRKPPREVHEFFLDGTEYDNFEKNCELGAQRHGGLWLSANSVASSAASGLGIDISRPAMKRLITLIVLRVLDRAHPTKAE